MFAIDNPIDLCLQVPKDYFISNKASLQNVGQFSLNKLFKHDLYEKYL